MQISSLVPYFFSQGPLTAAAAVDSFRTQHPMSESDSALLELAFALVGDGKDINRVRKARAAGSLLFASALQAREIASQHLSRLPFEKHDDPEMKMVKIYLKGLGVDYPSITDFRDFGNGFFETPLDKPLWHSSYFKDHDFVLISFRKEGVYYPLCIQYKIIFEGKSLDRSESLFCLSGYGAPQNRTDLMRELVFRAKEVVQAPFGWGRVHYARLTERPFTVKELPSFCDFGPYTMYVSHLLEVALPRIKKRNSVLVLGTGSGVEAVEIAKTKGNDVDATDIAQLAVVNTIASAIYTGVQDQVTAWVSDGFDSIPGRYDIILFNAPIPADFQDTPAADLNGQLHRRLFRDLPDHLTRGGVLYIMSVPDLAPYLPAGLEQHVEKQFGRNWDEPNYHFAISVIRVRRKGWFSSVLK